MPLLVADFCSALFVHRACVQDPDFLLDVLVSTYQRRASQRAAINAMPIYPTEGLLWDTTQVGSAESGAGPSCLRVV